MKTGKSYTRLEKVHLESKSCKINCFILCFVHKSFLKLTFITQDIFRVKLLVHRVTGDTVAVKIIDCKKHKDAAACVKKEICIHRLLVHPNIIRYYGQRQEGYLEYIFLEYASGGELFNKIGKFLNDSKNFNKYNSHFPLKD